MIKLNRFYNLLDKSGVKFFTGVPDSLLNDFCLFLNNNLSQEQHLITANEGNAIAAAAGYYLSTGNLPLVYMQNSGIGNSLNPLISLTNKETYSIPMLLLIGWRGSPNTKDWAHHMKQGKETPTILETLDIPWEVLENDDRDAVMKVEWATNRALDINGPVALLVEKGVLEKGSKDDLLLEHSEYSMTREEAIDNIVGLLPENTIYVATTGRATREIYEVKEARGLGHNHDFLNVGAMGHASSIALGLSIGNPNRLVVCLDGDASAIMHLGSFAIAGASKRSNFMHIVLNNGVHESVGGQSSVAHLINLTGIARNCGYSTVESEIKEKDKLESALDKLIRKDNPGFIDLRIRKGIRSDVPKLDISLEDLKTQFMSSIRKF